MVMWDWKMKVKENCWRGKYKAMEDEQNEGTKGFLFCFLMMQTDTTKASIKRHIAACVSLYSW